MVETLLFKKNGAELPKPFRGWVVHQIIDCSVSDYSILFDRCTHAVSEYFDIQILNKHSIIMGSMKSLCIKAGDIWNQGNYNISTLSAFLHVDDSTVRRYLKNLTRLGYLNVPYPIKNDINGGK